MSGSPTLREIVPGLWRLPVPLPGHALGHVNVYAFLARDGVLLVDAGWGGLAAWKALDDGLRHAGAAMSAVGRIVVSHYHSDHAGLAGRIQNTHGATVAMHAADAALLAERLFTPAAHVRRVADWLAGAGAPADLEEPAVSMARQFADHVDGLKPNEFLAGGEVIHHGEWELQLWHTPGHTQGHLCVYEPRHRILLTGDHIFASSNYNATYHAQATGDPIGDYLASLERLRELPVRVALPGHGPSLDNLPARVERLIAYHERRADQVAELLPPPGQPGESGWEVCCRVPRKRAWPELSHVGQISALGETLAHLRYARRRGRVTASDTVPVRWTASRPASPTEVGCA